MGRRNSVVSREVEDSDMANNKSEIGSGSAEAAEIGKGTPEVSADPAPGIDGASASEPGNREAVSESASAGDDSSDDPAVVSSGRRRWVIRTAVAGFFVLTVVAVVFAGVFGWQLHDKNQVADAAREASDTARTYAVTLTSIDSDHVDQNFTDVLNGATGDFKDMYSKSSNQLKSLLVQNKAVSKGRVVDSGIKSATKNEVEVVLFVDQSITNTQVTDPRIDRSRIVITMERIDGRWLASKVEMV